MHPSRRVMGGAILGGDPVLINTTEMARVRASRLISAAAVALLLVGCARPFPVGPGNLLAIRRADQPLKTGDPGYRTTLQIHWLGSASHLIQLGDLAVLTDPFFSHHNLLTVALGKIASNPAAVQAALEERPVPDVVFVGHSHYDHLLDVAQTLKGLSSDPPPIYGSRTTRNILCGFGNDVAQQWRQAVADSEWHNVDGVPGLEYRAILAEHAPQLPCVFLYPGEVTTCLGEPPDRACEFKVGPTYAYLFRLSNREVTYTVYFTGAASPFPRGLPDKSVSPIDAAILCVPGWKHVTGYPDGFIRRLEPRNIVLSHYNNFFQTDPTKRQLVPTADLHGFLSRAQEAAGYDGFVAILVPDVGTVVAIRKP